jgi:hypothetical protein
VSEAGVRGRAAGLADAPAARLLAIGLMLGTALAAVLAAVVIHRPSSSPILLGDPIRVEQALSTTAALFGDPVEAEIDIYTDDRRIPADSVRVRTDFRPYRIVATKVDRASHGDVSLLRTRISLQCLTRVCLPAQSGGRLVRFPPFAVSYRESGRDASGLVPWPPVRLFSRLPSDTGERVAIIDNPPPLGPRFARSPKALRTLLLLAAALLGIVGAVLVVTALWPPSLLSRRRWQRLSPLERTLLQVEAAARSDDEAVRRRTLDQLATRLGESSSPSLEVRTRALAWGQSAPEPEALTLLAEQVRTALNGGVRG